MKLFLKILAVLIAVAAVFFCGVVVGKEFLSNDSVDTAAVTEYKLKEVEPAAIESSDKVETESDSEETSDEKEDKNKQDENKEDDSENNNSEESKDTTEIASLNKNIVGSDTDVSGNAVSSNGDNDNKANDNNESTEKVITSKEFSDYILTDSRYERDPINGEYRDKLEGNEDPERMYFYKELGANKVNVLFYRYPDAGHAFGEYHAVQTINGEKMDMFGLDAIIEIYPESGLVQADHYGGSYGEADEMYFVIDEDGFLVKGGEAFIMYDREMLEAFNEYYEPDWEDVYYRFINDQTVEVTRDEFMSWKNSIIGNEKPIRKSEIDRMWMSAQEYLEHVE